jgi:hypothetical protein
MRGCHRLSKVLAASRAADAEQGVGVTRRRGRGSLQFEHAQQQQAFRTYLHALDLVDRRIERARACSTRPPGTVCGASWSPGCAACAASTR